MQRHEIQEIIRNTIDEKLDEADVPCDHRHRRRLLRALIRLATGLAADLRISYPIFVALVIEQTQREARSWQAVIEPDQQPDQTLN